MSQKKILQTLLASLILGSAIFALWWSTFVYLAKHRSFADFDKFVIEHSSALSIKDVNDEMEKILSFHPEIGNDEIIVFKFYPFEITFLSKATPPDVPEVRRTFAILEKYTPDNAEILISTARMYQIAWQLWHEEKDYMKAAHFYNRANTLKPHDLNNLAGMYCLFDSHGDIVSRDVVRKEIGDHYSFVNIKTLSCK